MLLFFANVQYIRPILSFSCVIVFLPVFRTDVGFCSPLVVPENGTIDQYLFRVGTNVTFICFPGFELNGNMTLQCKDSGNETSGKWSGEVPTCISAANGCEYWNCWNDNLGTNQKPLKMNKSLIVIWYLPE